MSLKAVIASILLSSSLFITSEAQAHDYTPEQVAKAQELANTMKTPVDIEALLAEADKLGVECDISTRIRIGSCETKIETEQSKRRTAILQAENERLDQENAELMREAQKLARELLNKL